MHKKERKHGKRKKENIVFSNILMKNEEKKRKQY